MPRGRPKIAHTEEFRQKRIAEFWALVDASAGPDTCWPWLGSRMKVGYGRMRFANRPDVGTHRLSWELSYGAIPDGLWVLHRCDNRICCNPKHLFLGTPYDNIHDMMNKGRRKDYDKHGERNPNCKLTDDQVAQLRADRSAGLPYSALAEKYDVWPGHISRLVNGKQR